ncbi:hypothetical protein CEP52_017682 [Fusarium oligoseptatum]|uniref:3'-5' exonuclease domain-containing protein n=1 Tax=Fusarium oligoseptatum TaxID=2604345 RepID=A0A428RJY9_9HYPO|nr:hypothetical protein CEP52_017682 [Fusarium oligoseptatum]
MAATTCFVDNTNFVSSMVDAIQGLPTTPPSLYVDLEGVNLCRHGSVSILQIYVLPHDRAYIIDVHTLGDQCFSTPEGNGVTFRQIPASQSIPNVFFDVRNDSDALYSHFNVNLAGVQDLQLMECSTRSRITLPPVNPSGLM